MSEVNHENSSSFSQFLNFKVESPFKFSIGDGNLLMAVPSKYRYLNDPIISEISGKLLNMKHPERLSFWRDFNLQTQLGRMWNLRSFAGSINSVERNVQLIREFLLRQSYPKTASLYFFPTSGNLVMLEQPETTSFSSDANLEMPRERFFNLLQFIRSKLERLERQPIVEGTSSFAVSLKYKYRILVEIFGKLVTHEQPERSMVLSDFKSCKFSGI